MTAVDISLTVINMMAELSSQTHPALNFMHMNVCSLEFPDESFDAVIAKATMDVIMCGEGSVGNVAKMCFEVSRVLRPGGVFFVVSHEKDYMQYLDPETVRRNRIISSGRPREGGGGSSLRIERDSRATRRQAQANKDFGWSVTQETVLKPCLNPKLLPTDEKGNLLVHHIYICKKKSDHGTT